jgi:hypothetical protein
MVYIVGDYFKIFTFAVTKLIVSHKVENHLVVYAFTIVFTQIIFTIFCRIAMFVNK